MSALPPGPPSPTYSELELAALRLRYEATSQALSTAICLATGGEVIHAPDATLTWMPVKYWANGLVSPRLAEDTAERRLEEILHFFREHRTEARLRLGPSTTPANLAEYLNRRGFPHPTAMPIMGADLARLRTDLPLARGVTVRVLDDYLHLLRQPRSPLAAVSSVRQPRLAAAFQKLAEERPRRLWTLVGEMEGAAVSAVILFQHEDTVTGFHFEVLPDHRRHGLGAAMIAEMLRLSRELGARYAVLGASGQGSRYYPRFGFVSLDKMPVYHYTRALQRRDDQAEV